MFTPDRAYLLVGLPRTGSSVLAEALTATGLLGHPQEYFWRMVERRHAEEMGVAAPVEDDYGPYLDAALRYGTTENGVFAAKLFWEHAKDLVRRAASVATLAGLSPLERLWAPFGPDLRTVLIRRRCLDSAMSLWRAEASNVWGLRPGDQPPKAPKQLDVWRVTVLHAEAHAGDDGWIDLLAASGREPLHLTYDGIAADLRGTVERIAEHVDVDLPRDARAAAATYVQQADEATERFVAEWIAATGGCPRCC